MRTKLLIILLTCSSITMAFSHELKYIGMPVGGICAGQVYLGGDGQLWNWDIFNIAVSEPGGPGDRYYRNPLTQEELFANGFGIRVKQGEKSYARRLNMNGFSNVTFDGKYPIGEVNYSDKNVPIDVRLKAYSPFIPTNAEDSGLPVTVLEYTVTNTSDEDVSIELMGWLQNMSCYQTAKGASGNHVNSVVKGSNFIRVDLSSQNTNSNLHPDWGGMSLTLIDGATASAKCIKTKGIPLYESTNLLDEASSNIGEPIVGGVTGKAELAKGESRTFKFLISWYFPNIHLWDKGHKVEDINNLRYFYSSSFDNSGSVAKYVVDNPELMSTTKEWVDTWYDSSLPRWFLDRTFLNVSTLATVATVRFNDLTDSKDNEGRFYASEGVYLGEGTCTHVFHYEQALGRVFPSLARQLREQVDLGLSYDDSGYVKYRGEFSHIGQHDLRGHAIDGQAGTILRIYREHLMSDDNSLIKNNWTKIKSLMNYMIAQDKELTGKTDGIIEGVQYNTLDRMWYGKIAWISGLYAASLKASAKMAMVAGDNRFARECDKIAKQAYKNIGEELFNGEYFYQIVDPNNLETPNTNVGCHADQLLGQYWASQLDLGYIVDPAKVKTALNSIMKYNFVTNYGDYLKTAKIPIRRWYADDDEAGLIMCTFPRGGEDIAPGKDKSEHEKLIVGYFSEIWTGQEHAVSALLMNEKLVDQAMLLESTICDRYAPHKRNPYNEIEYGNHYTRAMSGYAPFIAASGYHYDGPNGIMKFSPNVNPNDFKSAFISAKGWGSFLQELSEDENKYSLSLKHGELHLSELHLITTKSKANKINVTLNGQEVNSRVKIDSNNLTIVLTEIELNKNDVLNINLL